MGENMHYRAGRREFAEELAAMLWPERYPPGHRLHDPDHMYWEQADPLMLLTNERLREMTDDEILDAAMEHANYDPPEDLEPPFTPERRARLTGMIINERDR